MSAVDVAFCATSKSGLGHLARIHHIANALRNSTNSARLTLLSNATLPANIFRCRHKGTELFDEVKISEKTDFTRVLTQLRSHVVVVDTAVVPDVGRLTVPIVLVMRETRRDKLPQFAPGPGQGWDLVIVPNPPEHWSPNGKLLPAHAIQHVGWIYEDVAGKPVLNKSKSNSGSGQRKILLCAGGGGNSEWSEWELRLRQLISDSSGKLGCDLHVTQLLGPRASASARFEWSDETLSSIDGLSSHMEQYDLIITATGYNTVLELARCTTPALLIPLNRTFDDQYTRAQQWAPSLGYLFDPNDIPGALAWCAEELACGKRRNRVQLGDSGAAAAAALIRQFAQKSFADAC